jgi:hypothetical protein
VTRVATTGLALVGLLATVSNADTTLTAVPLPGGTSAAGAYTLASIYDQSTSLDTLSASSTRLDPGFLCVESSDLGRLGDINHDGVVNGVDLAIVLGAWGVCGAGTCPTDIDRDGLVNGVDLAVVLSNWG